MGYSLNTWVPPNVTSKARLGYTAIKRWGLVDAFTRHCLRFHCRENDLVFGAASQTD